MASIGSPLSICVISDGRYPSRWTDTQQTVKTIAALVQHQSRVTLMAPRSVRRWLAPATARRQEIATYYGVPAHFSLAQLPVPELPFRIDEALHGILAPLYARFRRHDVVYTRKIVPLAVALLTGQYAVFESHRFLRAHYPWAARLLRLVMHRPRFLGVVTNAQLIADAFVGMGFDREAVAVAHNCFDPADLEPRLSAPVARQQLGLPLDAPLVVYTGHIQERKGINTVIALAARTPEIRYLVCGGSTDDVAHARALASTAGASNLTFTGWVDVSRLAPYLYAADVLLIPPTAAPLRQHGNTVLPIKTYTYLAAGRPILGPRQADIEEVLHHDRNAWLVAPDDLNAAVDGVRRLCGERSLAERLGAQALGDSQRYTWSARAVTIQQFIACRLANQRAGGAPHGAMSPSADHGSAALNGDSSPHR